MADDSRSSDELPDLTECLEGLGSNMISVLRQSGEIDDAEIEMELVDGFTKEEIGEARLKLFECAKEKVIRILCTSNAGGFSDHDGTTEVTEYRLLSRRAVEQWELVPRRKKNNFAKDALELLVFSLDTGACFPAKLVKGLSMEKGLYERLPEAEIEAITQLNKDIELAGGRYSVEIVNNGVSETHLITVAPNGEAGGKIPVQVEPIGQDTTVDVHEKEAVSESHNCCEKNDNGALFVSVKNFVEMSEKVMKTLSGTDDAMKTAYQYHQEYMERITRDSENEVKQIMEWQKRVDDRLEKLEKQKSGHVPVVATENGDHMSGNENRGRVENDNSDPSGRLSMGQRSGNRNNVKVRTVR